MSDSSDIITRIEEALEELRPHLKADGGDVEFVEVTSDNRVLVRWVGSCINCNMAQFTMKAGIEQTIKSKVPEIVGVEAIN